MPLGRVIAELRDDLRNRVEVSWHHETWHVTASSFDTALAYANARRVWRTATRSWARSSGAS